MKKILREVKEGILQLTIVDERWYIDSTPKGSEFFPSTTWIAGCYPKGVQFYKWLAEQGWDESQAIKVTAGEKGSKVHQAIDSLLEGNEVKMETCFMNPTTGLQEELDADGYACVASFADWWKTANAKTLGHDIPFINREGKYAGTIDWVGLIPDGDQLVPWMLDFKTSQHIWTEYELQLSAYLHAHPNVTVEQKHGDKLLKVSKPIQKMGILQVGYKLNKRHWKLTELEDKFALFEVAHAIWYNEHGNEQPKKLEFPESLKL